MEATSKAVKCRHVAVRPSEDALQRSNASFISISPVPRCARACVRGLAVFLVTDVLAFVAATILQVVKTSQNCKAKTFPVNTQES